MHYSCAVEIPKEMSFEIAAMTEPASCCLSGTEMIEDLEACVDGKPIRAIE